MPWRRAPAWPEMPPPRVLRMLRACINAQLLEVLRAEGVVGQHPLDDAHQGDDGVLLDLAATGDRADAARVEGVTVDRLVTLGVAGQADLVGVDDNNMVAAVHVRRPLRLVLAA